MMKLIALILLLTSNAWAARPEIAFARETEVSNRAQITWADIASVKNGTTELLAELKEIPYTGGGIGEIRKELRERKSSGVFGQLDTKFTLPSEFQMKTVKGYSSAEFHRKILNMLGAACAECQFELTTVTDKNVLLTADWTIDESVIKPTGQMLVPVSCAGATAWIPVKVRVLREGLVARHTIQFGQKLVASDFESKIVDTGGIKDIPAIQKDLEGTVLNRSLSAGQIVSRADLRREDMVQRGQAVKVLTGDEEFEISTSAVAEQNGHQGDVVKVKTTDSGKIMSAVVTGQAEVRVQ